MNNKTMIILLASIVCICLRANLWAGDHGHKAPAGGDIQMFGEPEGEDQQQLNLNSVFNRREDSKYPIQKQQNT